MVLRRRPALADRLEIGGRRCQRGDGRLVRMYDGADVDARAVDLRMDRRLGMKKVRLLRAAVAIINTPPCGSVSPSPRPFASMAYPPCGSVRYTWPRKKCSLLRVAGSCSRARCLNGSLSTRPSRAFQRFSDVRYRARTIRISGSARQVGPGLSLTAHRQAHHVEAGVLRNWMCDSSRVGHGIPPPRKGSPLPSRSTTTKPLWIATGRAEHLALPPFRAQGCGRDMQKPFPYSRLEKRCASDGVASDGSAVEDASPCRR